jgi:uncharacterized membrane-anchored protein YitT (DUF2179 family)
MGTGAEPPAPPKRLRAPGRALRRRAGRPLRRPAREALNAVLIAAGALSAAFGIHGFLLSSNFIDGGVTGISMLLAAATGLPLAVLLPLINLPFIALAYRHLGRAFALRSVLAIGALAAILATVHFPDVTPDLVLTAVFGGFFIGAGIGLAIRGRAVLDGTEIAALIISKWSGHLRVGDVILAFNVVIFFAAIWVLGVEEALYSILTYVTAARTLDFVVHGIEEFTAVTVVSERSGAIRERVLSELGRGVTVYKGEGGLSGAEVDILYCVVTRLEIGRVKRIAREEDPSAFVVTHALADAEGGAVGKAAHH